MTPHQTRLVKLRERDEAFARDFGRPNAEVLTESHDSGQQGYDNGESKQRGGSLFRQISSAQNVLGITR